MNEVKKWSLDGLKVNNVVVIDVYDGDTFKIVLPICCKKYIFSCRLLGIDTAEIRSNESSEKEFAIQTRDYVKTLFDEHTVNITCHEFDKYGRVLCTIECQKMNCNDAFVLSTHLIENGFGYFYDGGKRKLFNEWKK